VLPEVGSTMTDSRGRMRPSLGRLDHREGDAVLQRSARVELLAFAEHVSHRRIDQMTQPNDRCSSDQVQHVLDGERGHVAQLRNITFAARPHDFG